MISSCPLITPGIDFQLSLLEKNRSRMLEIIQDLSLENLLFIPKGFRNNLLWNLGHVLVSQQILCYGKSETPLHIPAYFVALFGKGTHPGQWGGKMEVEELKTWLVETSRLLRSDLEKDRFGKMQPYETSMGLRLSNINDTLAYVVWHEGLHFGTMLAMRKLI